MHAILIATANEPIGTTYLIIPNIPPKKSLSNIPAYPDSVYISTVSKMLNIIVEITPKFIELFLLFLPLLFLFAIFTIFPPKCFGNLV